MGNHGDRWGNLGVRWVSVVTLDLKGDVSRTGWTEDAVVTMVLTDGIQGRSGNHGDDGSVRHDGAVHVHLLGRGQRAAERRGAVTPARPL